MNHDQPAQKNLVRICPLLSSAITYEIRQEGKKPVRIHEIARSPCIKGECEMFDIGTFTCLFKKART
jgi:hypothetical protein